MPPPPPPPLAVPRHAARLPPLGMCIFLVSVVASCVARCAARYGLRPPPPRHAIRVCLVSPPGCDWRACVMALIGASIVPAALTFGVVVECTDLDGLESAGELRSHVWLHCTTPARSDDPARMLRRLVRRFVTGTETAVVVIDPRVRLRHGWDQGVIECTRSSGAHVLTSPVTRHEGAAAFPTLRQRSSGAIVRSDARPFRRRASRRADVVVASACWCFELTAGPPSLLRAMALRAGDGERDAAGVPPTASFCVPTEPLLEADAALEEAVLAAADEHVPLPRPAHSRLTSCQALGLSAVPSARELFMKYGSAEAARLAIKLDRRVSRGAQ